MVIQIASWADFGYRKLGPLPSSGGGLTPAQVAEVIQRGGEYELKEDFWARRRPRRKSAHFHESIQLVTTFSHDTPMDEERLRFVDAHVASPWTQAEGAWARVRADPTLLVEAVEMAETVEDRWRGFYRLAQALYYVGPERLRPMFRDKVAPCFFRLYPQGKIVVLRYDTAVDGAAATQRVLYALAQAPHPELAGTNFEGVRTLQRWHMASLTGLMPALLDLFNFLFYPFVSGTCAGLHGLVFLFLLDPPERHQPAPFPRNWLGYPAHSASFAREHCEAIEIIRDPSGPAHERAAHQRYCHAKGFSADERLILLQWYISRVNRLLYEVTDVANFTEGRDPQAAIDPVFGFEHMMTVDRLLRKTLLAMSLDEAAAANLTAFEIADLYDTLSERFGNHTGKTSFFKTLFHSQDAPALLAPRLAALPAPFGVYFSDLCTQVYCKIEETVVASVWRQKKVTPAGVLVRDKTLTREEAMPVPQFVAEVMRAYRNAHHGYFSADPLSHNRPSRFLFIVDGNLPVEMSVLPVLWWLAYLADPSMVGWRHLDINAYD